MDDLARLIEARPSRCRSTARRTVGGVTVVVPPRGLVRGSHGVLGFSLAWFGVMGVITVIWSFIFLPTSGSPSGGLPLPLVLVGIFFALFLGLFWLIGFGLLAFAIDRGRRRAIIDTIDGSVVVTARRLFRTEQHTWLAGDLSGLEVSVSDENVDDRIFHELRFVPAEGEPVLLLSGRAKAELDWIAAVVRTSIGLAEPEAQESS